MKLAIYGDSHANSYINRSVNDDISWAQILCYDHGYQLTNFGCGGSSLFYSYDQFIHSHSDYDQIIFFVTGVGRIYLPETHGLIKQHRHVTGYNMADYYLRNFSHDKLYTEIFSAACNYFTYIKNDAADQLFHNLMIEKISSVRSDSVIIDIKNFAGGNDSDMKYWNKDSTEVYANYRDLRHCHFSQEKHKELAKQINQAIKNSNQFSYESLIDIKPSKSFEKYFVPIDSINDPLVSFDQHLKDYE